MTLHRITIVWLATAFGCGQTDAHGEPAIGNAGTGAATNTQAQAGTAASRAGASVASTNPGSAIGGAPATGGKAPSSTPVVAGGAGGVAAIGGRGVCSGSSEMMDQVCETYSTCAGGQAVSLCSLPGADHVLYQNMSGLSVPMTAWALFQKHPQN